MLGLGGLKYNLQGQGQGQGQLGKNLRDIRVDRRFSIRGEEKEERVGVSFPRDETREICVCVCVCVCVVLAFAPGGSNCTDKFQRVRRANGSMLPDRRDNLSCLRAIIPAKLVSIVC